MDGRTLVGHVFKKIEVPSSYVCEVNCFVEADCVSFNVATLAEGKHRCELSNSDHRVHPKDLVFGVGVIYTPVTVKVTSYNFRLFALNDWSTTAPGSSLFLPEEEEKGPRERG